jgi:hypothetical protein
LLAKVEQLMALNQKFITDLYPARPEPIQYLTENGFRIVRRCDVDDSFPPDGIEHCFIVRDPDGYELDITVKFDTRAAAEVIQRSRRRITFESSFWVNAAERHLAEYLWEQNDYPPNAHLTISQLTLDDMDLATRWDSDKEKNESSLR